MVDTALRLGPRCSVYLTKNTSASPPLWVVVINRSGDMRPVASVHSEITARKRFMRAIREYRYGYV